MLPTNAELDYFRLTPTECDVIRYYMKRTIWDGHSVRTPFRYLTWKEGAFADPLLRISRGGRWIYLDRGPGRHTIVSNGDVFYVCRVEEAEVL